MAAESHVPLPGINRDIPVDSTNVYVDMLDHKKYVDGPDGFVIPVRFSQIDDTRYTDQVRANQLAHRRREDAAETIGQAAIFLGDLV